MTENSSLTPRHFIAITALISGVVFIGFLLRKGPLRGFYLLGAGSLYVAFLVAAVVVVIDS